MPAHSLLFSKSTKGADRLKVPIRRTNRYQQYCITLSSSRFIHSPGSQPTSLKSILILSSHRRLGLPQGFFPLGFATKILYAFLDCSKRATCPAHLSRLDLRLLIMLGEEYNACSSALCNFLHSSVISSFLAPNIFLSSLLYSQTPLIYAPLSR